MPAKISIPVMVALLLGTLVTQTLAEVPDCYDYEAQNAILAHSRLPYNVKDILFVGDLGYVLGDFPRKLKVVDFTDLEYPVTLASLDIDAGHGFLRRDGDRLYVVTFRKIWIIDISNPVEPVLLGRMDTNELFDLQPDGDFLYLAGGYHSFQVISVADPANPEIVATIWAIENADHILLHQGHAILNDKGFGLRIFDVADPANPIERGVYPVNWWMGEARMVGDLAYFGVRNQGIFVVDFSVLWEPRPIGSQLGFDCWRFEVAGDQCYVIDPDEGLAVLDVSNLPRIEASPFIAYLNRAYGLELRDGLPLVTLGNRDLLLIDPGVTYERTESATLIQSSGLTLWNLESDGHLLYGTYRDDVEITRGLKVLDVSPTAAVTEVGRLHTILTPADLALEGSLIYLALQNTGMAVIDVADPREPVLISEIHLPTDTYAVAVDGGTAYAGTRGYSNTDGRLITIDVRDPSQPKQIHSLQLGHTVTSVAVAGPLVVAGSGGSLVHVISGYGLGTTPPRLLASLQLSDGVAIDLEVSGPLIYAITSRDLVIVDVSLPSMPQIIGTWTPIDHDIGLHQISLRGDLLYAGTRHHGVAIIDVSEPTEPQLVGFAPAPELVQGVVVNDRALFVGQYTGGLHKWPLPCGEQLAPVPDQQRESPVAVPPGLQAFVAPGQSTVTIRFTLERAQPVRLSVFDISGRRVADLDDRLGIAGEQHATWSGRDNRGRLVPSGTYLIRLQSGDRVSSSKVVLVR